MEEILVTDGLDDWY